MAGEGPLGPSLDDSTSRLVQDRPRAWWRELPILLVIALVIAVLIKSFLVQVFYVPSVSMQPSLEPEDRILVCRICVTTAGVGHGDIIVFSDPQPTPEGERGLVGGLLHWIAEGIGVASPEHEDFVKRVIGLPGDVVELDDGRLFVNGERAEEPYLDPNIDTSSYGPTTVPDGMLFVLGDNRLESGDSRCSREEGCTGLVPEDVVIGTVLLRIWPPSRAGGL